MPCVTVVAVRGATWSQPPGRRGLQPGGIPGYHKWNAVLIFLLCDVQYFKTNVSEVESKVGVCVCVCDECSLVTIKSGYFQKKS